MNYPQVLFEKDIVYLKNELTKNKYVLCEVIGFVSQNGVYYVKPLPNYVEGLFNENIYSATIDDLYKNKNELENIDKLKGEVK